MEKQFLFEGEEIILVSNDNAVTLTSQRIQQDLYTMGNMHFVSMHLANINTIEVTTDKHTSFSVLGIILGLAGPILCLFGLGLLPMFIGLGMAILLLLLYFQTRSHTLILGSDAGIKMKILARGMDHEAILRFIEQLETAKHLIPKT